jgi:lipopolysaccharide assembly protein A
MKRGFYLILGSIVVFFGVTFALKNPQTTEISYYFGLNLSVPVSVLLTVIFIVGVLIGYLAGLMKLFKVRGELNKIRKEKQVLEKALAETRVMTIRDVV